MASFTERLYLTEGLTLETQDNEFIKIGNARLAEVDVRILIEALRHWVLTRKIKYDET